MCWSEGDVISSLLSAITHPHFHSHTCTHTHTVLLLLLQCSHDTNNLCLPPPHRLASISPPFLPPVLGNPDMPTSIDLESIRLLIRLLSCDSLHTSRLMYNYCRSGKNHPRPPSPHSSVLHLSVKIRPPIFLLSAFGNRRTGPSCLRSVPEAWVAEWGHPLLHLHFNGNPRWQERGPIKPAGAKGNNLESCCHVRADRKSKRKLTLFAVPN